jgi:hypothetical protein
VVHLYNFLLLLYPRAHRQEFAEEMLSVFREAHRDCASLGFKTRVRFSLREIAGLLAGAFREHTKVHENLRGGAVPMFRFPRRTVILLVLALVIVLAGMQITNGIPSDALSPGVSIWRLFFPDVLQALLGITYVLGLLGFVLLRAAGRQIVSARSSSRPGRHKDTSHR